ncbi:hypothetical protein RI054_04g24580 [Pseudoscourfieldia marina]
MDVRRAAGDAKPKHAQQQFLNTSSSGNARTHYQHTHKNASPHSRAMCMTPYTRNLDDGKGAGIDHVGDNCDKLAASFKHVPHEGACRHGSGGDDATSYFQMQDACAIRCTYLFRRRVFVETRNNADSSRGCIGYMHSESQHQTDAAKLATSRGCRSAVERNARLRTSYRVSHTNDDVALRNSMITKARSSAGNRQLRRSSLHARHNNTSAETTLPQLAPNSPMPTAETERTQGSLRVATERNEA